MYTRNDDVDRVDWMMEEAHREYVPVIFARDRAEAEDYRSMLEARDIPARIEPPKGGATTSAVLDGAVPVFVADGWHDQATGLLAVAERSSRVVAADDDDLEEDEFDDDDDDDDDDDLDDLDDDFDDDDDDDVEEDFEEEDE